MSSPPLRNRPRLAATGGRARLLVLLWVPMLALPAGCRDGVPPDPRAMSDSGMTSPEWPGAASAAVSLTCDDGTADHIHLVAPLLDAHGIRATFFIVPSWTGAKTNGTTWDDWRRVHRAGHEVGSHTETHRRLVDLTDAELDHELRTSRGEIERNIAGSRCISLAYPYGVWDPRVRAAAGRYYVAARTAGGVSFLKNRDLLVLPAVMPVGDFPVDRLARGLRQAIARGDWLILAFHGITGDRTPPSEAGWAPRSVEYLQALLREMERLGRRLWVAPLGDVAEYLRAHHGTEIDAPSPAG